MLKRFAILSVLVWIFPLESSAEIKNEYLGDISVSVEGAARTKPRVIESLVEKCLVKNGYKTWESVSAGELSQCLSNSRLFKKVEVQVERSKISVKVADRWTLLPIPNFYASDGKRSAGVFIFDSNFLGYGKSVGLGGAVSTEGNTFSIMYTDPAVNYTNTTFGVIAHRSVTDIYAYDSTNIIYGFNKREEGVSISPGYNLTPKLGISVSFGYSDRSYSQIDSYSFSIPGDYTATNVGARVSYRNSDYKLFYNDGWTTSLMWSQQVHRSDGFDNVSQLSANGEWDIVMFQKHALQLGLHASRQSDNSNPGDVAMYGRGKGFRGIEPAGLWTRKIAAASVDYQIPLAKTGHGTFTVAPFMDYGTYKQYFSGNGSNYATYGIGAYYFVNFINLPGIGLVFGRNQEFMGSFAAIQIGMGFR